MILTMIIIMMIMTMTKNEDEKEDVMMMKGIQKKKDEGKRKNGEIEKYSK